MHTSSDKLTKKALLKGIKDLPEEFTIDELLERMTVIRKVDRGMRELQEGKGLDPEKARKKLAKWLK